MNKDDRARRAAVMFEDGMRRSLILDHLNITDKQLASAVVKHAEHATEQTHDVDEGFFSRIDTERKAYWLGFLFGAGSISLRPLSLNITLEGHYREHLAMFLGEINGSHELLHAVESKWDPAQPHCDVTIASSKMVQDLIAHGLMMPRSKVLAGPVGVSKSLSRHFIRGLVDAKGHVGVYNNYCSVEIVGPHDLIQWCAEQAPLTLPRPLPHKSTWRLRAQGAAAGSLVDYLYNYTSVYLGANNEKALKVFSQGATGVLPGGMEKRIAKRYSSGDSISVLAETYDVSADVIKRVLHMRGTPLRRASRGNNK